MDIGGTVVETPHDDPVAYAPDWRHLVARAVLDRKTFIPRELKDDEYLVAHLAYLRSLPAGVRDKMATMAMKWYTHTAGDNVRYYLEALLLTDQSIPIIAEDIGVDESTIRLYERIYFNSRDDLFELKSSCMLRTNLALGPLVTANYKTEKHVVWRIIAAQTGYTPLMYMWGWERIAHGVMQHGNELLKLIMDRAKGKMVDKIFSGQRIETVDIVGLMGHYIEHERHLREIGQQDQGSDSQALLMKVLQLAAPKMVAAAISADEIEAQNKAFRSKLQLEKKISETRIEDKGSLAGQTAANALMHARVKG